jgi:hypothetical protein
MLTYPEVHPAGDVSDGTAPTGFSWTDAIIRTAMKPAIENPNTLN